jgi:hypothetical protein
VGEKSHLKDHYSRCEGTDVMRWKLYSSNYIFQVTDQVRWGVWLGRHICYKTTQVSYEELKENRNLL